MSTKKILKNLKKSMLKLCFELRQRTDQNILSPKILKLIQGVSKER